MCGAVERRSSRGLAGVVRYVDQGSHEVHCLERVLFIGFHISAELSGRLRAWLLSVKRAQALAPCGAAGVPDFDGLMRLLQSQSTRKLYGDRPGVVWVN